MNVNLEFLPSHKSALLEKGNRTMSQKGEGRERNAKSAGLELVASFVR